MGFLTLQDGTRVKVSGEVAQEAERYAEGNGARAIIKTETKGGYFYTLKSFGSGEERNLYLDTQERMFRFAASQKQEEDEDEAWFAVWDLINTKNLPFLSAGLVGFAGLLAMLHKLLGAWGFDKDSYRFRRPRVT